VPSFGLPLFSLRFLAKSFLLQIYWIKLCTFREVRMNYLRRFSLRCRGSHGSSSLPTLRPVSLHFLSCAIFFTNSDILKLDALEKLLARKYKFVPLISRFHSIFAASFRSVSQGTTTSFPFSPDNHRDALPVGKPASGLDFPHKLA
jgi:hypothetical protein